MNPDSDPQEHAAEEAPENAPAGGEGRLHRLKQFFVRGYVRILDALSGVLKRLRDRVQTPGQGEGGEEGVERPSRKKAKEPPPTVEIPPVPRSHVRSSLIYLLVLIIGVIAGMTFSFALLSKMLINQYQKIDDQREEYSQLEKQHSRILESEAKYRKKLSEIEAQVQAARAKEPPSHESINPATPMPAPPIQEKRALLPNKTGKCELESSKPGDLTKCLEEFKRK